MPPNTHATWTAHPPGRTGMRRVLAVLATLTALGALLVASPTRADTPTQAGAIAFSGQGESTDTHIWVEAPYRVGNFASGADGDSAGTTRADLYMVFERLDSLTDLTCRGSNGIGTAEIGDNTYEFHDADFTVVQGDVYGAWLVTGRWTDPASGSEGVLLAVVWRHAGSFSVDENGCPEYGGMYGGLLLAPDDAAPSPEELLDLVGDNAPDVSDLLDLVKIEPPEEFEKPSSNCEFNGGEPIFDTTTEGVRKFVYTYQPTVDEAWVCARVEDTSTGEGYGGRLEATPGDADPQVTGLPGTPTTDSNSTACTDTTDPPNEVPGTHPISSGVVATVDYMIDAYANDSEAWVCLQVENQDLRVIVPLGGDDGSSVSAGTVATWYPDEGTPSP